MNKRKLKILWLGEAAYLNSGYAVYGKEVVGRLHATGKYDIAELGIYGHMNDTRRFDIPWTHYANLPDTHDDDGIYHSDTLNQFGQWKFEDVCLDFQPDVVWDIRDWWMALANGNDVILTNTGHKNVSDIQVGDLVLTHKGRFRPVTRVFNKLYSGNVYSIKCSNVPCRLDLTESHPVLAIRRTSSGLPDFSKEKPQWIDSHQLDKGDIVCIPRYSQEARRPHLTYTGNLARLIGYYTAEGCVLYEGKKKHGILKGIQLTFSTHESVFITDAVNIIRQTYNIEPTVKHKKDNSCVIRAYSKDMAQEMVDICPGTAKTKCISDPVNIEYEEFLCGYFRGDGCTNKESKRSSCCTSSKSLALQVFQMCINLGFLPSCSHNKNKLNGKTYYRYIFSFNAEAHEYFNGLYQHKIQQPIALSKRIGSEYVYVTIDNINVHTTNNIPVYNFEVEEDNTYVSSFTLHNCEYVERSPFRQNYHWTIMPTVDSIPQKEQWLETYRNADSIFTYTEFSRDYLKNNGINVLGMAPPAADHEVFKPVPDRLAHRKHWGLHKDVFIIGTVMRNQRRKLYPDLIQSFRKFLDTSPALADKTYLYIHTSYPDNGWDIPQLLREAGVGNKVLFTYICPQCGYIAPHFFAGSTKACNRCGNYTATLPSVHVGVTPAEMASILNFMDLYIQYSICEGFGMPQVEAAACGTPFAAVNYSAMESVLKNLDGIPIPVQRMFREPESGSFRALPDNDKFVAILQSFLGSPQPIRKQKGRKTYLACKQHYDWDKTAKVWEDHFDKLEPTDKWNGPPQIRMPNPQVPQNVSNEEFVKWVVANVWGEPSMIHSYIALRLLRDLNNKSRVVSTGGVFYNEDSLQARERHQPFDRDKAIEEMAKMANLRNMWEEKRCGLRQDHVPAFIQNKKEATT
jgi:glycosyltransferase involved in cell wall biosynthesis